MAGGNMKAIKTRIKSVESTMQITKAMELVASSKLRKAKERAERTRPYFDLLHKALADISGTGADFTSPFTAPRTIHTTCYVVIAGDRGLAGGYNANLFRTANAEMADKNVFVLPVGKRAVEYYEKRDFLILSTHYALADDVDMTRCSEMAKLLTDSFLAEKFDELYIIYTEFVSVLSQKPQVLSVLPLRSLQEEETDNTTKPLTQVLYDPSSETVFNEIVPNYVSGLIFGALSESVASEHGARRTAMNAASQNAEEMIDTLSLKYNQARQAAITQEITEIIGGAEA